MKCSTGSTLSLWSATEPLVERLSLAGDARADVCVVGAGIAGLTTAYLLSKAGRSVVVLDDGPIAGGETSRTTAHLSNVIDDRFQVIERHHGEEGARLARASHGAAIDEIESIAAQESLRCGFQRVPGYLFLGPEHDVEFLRSERDAALRAGFASVDELPRVPHLPFDSGPCLRFERQAQFHPLRYLAGLAGAIERYGGRIHAHTHVTGVEGGSTAVVTTSAGPEVRAAAVVVATNSPVNDRVKIHTKQAAYRTYAIALRVPEESLAPALCWDTWDPLESTCRHASLSIL